MLQAAGARQLPAGGHREAEEATGKEETTLYGPDTTTQPGAEQAKEQEQQPGEWSVRLLFNYFTKSGYILLKEFNAFEGFIISVQFLFQVIPDPSVCLILYRWIVYVFFFWWVNL